MEWHQFENLSLPSLQVHTSVMYYLLLKKIVGGSLTLPNHNRLN